MKNARFCTAILLTALLPTGSMAAGAPIQEMQQSEKPARPKDLILLRQPINQTSREGESVSVAFAAQHDTGVSYEARDLPPGLLLDPASGMVTGIVAPVTAGDYAVTIEATSPTHWEAVTLYWTVLDVTLPQLASPGVQVATAGAAVDLQLVPSDIRPGTLSFASAGLPPGLDVDPSTGKISGTIAGHSVRTTYYVTVTVSDGQVLGGTVFTWIVLPNQ